MPKNIEVKKELEALKFDILNALILRHDLNSIINMTLIKIDNIMMMDKKEYLKVIWKQ